MPFNPIIVEKTWRIPIKIIYLHTKYKYINH